MAKIKILSPEIIAKIAAGEVIERPNFAVKELIENALDASATVIKVEVEKAGLQKIIITDNGEGMSKEDLELSYLRHSTSKIETETDLLKVTTRGFRGEALSSIAAIADVTLQSRKKGIVAGHSIELVNGALKKSVAVGMPVGTVVKVENLFSHLPARQKFLHGQETEFRLLTQTVIAQALSYPAVAFTLTHNKRVIFSLPKNQTLLERAVGLLGSDLATGLFPISYDAPYIKVSGYIGHPQLSSNSATKSFLFVNNRPVHHKGVSSIIKQSYGKLLHAHALPPFLLFLITPPEMVDVNVHPRKEEVSFAHETTIIEALLFAVTTALKKSNLLYRSDLSDGGTNTYGAKLLRREVMGTKIRPLSDESIQVHNLYLVKETQDGLLMVDQHAAHERILYEQLLSALKIKKEILTLKKPIALSLSLTESQLLSQHLKSLKKVGFSLKKSGNNNFTIITVPTLFKDRDFKQIIRDALSDLEELGMISIDRQTDTMLSYLACRSAIKAGDALSEIQRKDLFATLLKTKTNYTCPHGRPVQFEVKLRDLEKIFHRR